MGWLLALRWLFTGKAACALCGLQESLQSGRFSVCEAAQMALLPLALLVVNACCAAALPKTGIVGEPVCFHFAPVPGPAVFS